MRLREAMKIVLDQAAANAPRGEVRDALELVCASAQVRQILGTWTPREIPAGPCGKGAIGETLPGRARAKIIFGAAYPPVTDAPKETPRVAVRRITGSRY